MSLTLALAGDTMLGRKVAEKLRTVRGDPTQALFAPEVIERTRDADLFVLNLECCISDRGRRWPDPRKPFFFRAPPSAVEVLTGLGVDAVTLANNHALDYGEEALVDTVLLLDDAGIAHVGAGEDRAAARAPTVLESKDGFRLGVVGWSDHPRDFAAGPSAAGIAYADLAQHALPHWIRQAIGALDADLVLVSPHWGPNMTTEPVARVSTAASELAGTAAGLVAGHSAHAFHGVARRGDLAVIFDLGDFVDDYAVDAEARNDLGLLWLVDVDERGPVRVRALPLALDYCYTRLAGPEEHAIVRRLFERRCARVGTQALVDRGGELVVPLR